MRRNEQVWWVSATVMSLAAFSFFSGFGLRGLYEGFRGHQPGDDSAGGFPRLASAAPKVASPDVRPQTLYWDVLRKLRLYYVEELPDDSKLAYGSIDAMLNQLNDPNTRALSKEEVDAFRDAQHGVFRGLGAVLTISRPGGSTDEAGAKKPGADNEMEENGMPMPSSTKPGEANRGVRTITVVSVMPGSPAEKAGLQPGDRITHIDGRWIAPAHVSFRLLTQLTEPLGPQDGRPRHPDDDEPMPNPEANPEREKARKELDEARERWKSAVELPVVLRDLQTREQGTHELTIERGQPVKSLKVKVALAKTTVEPVSSRTLNPTTGYLNIRLFNEDTPAQVAKATAAFQKANVKNLVVDLRESAGGSLESARDVAGVLLGDGKFAALKERDADRKLVTRAVMSKAVEARFNPTAISVMVDGGTAGVAEVLAAALRDQRGAKLVGSTTFGDGTLQELVMLDNGAGFTLTRAQMLTSKNGEFNAKGLKADVVPQGDPIQAALAALSRPAATKTATGGGA